MSGTDLGQSWLMCPQLPRGFWSGGSSNACSLTMNTNAEYYWILLLYSSHRQDNVSKFAHAKSDNQNSWLSLYTSCCVNTMSGCVCAGFMAAWDQRAVLWRKRNITTLSLHELARQNLKPRSEITGIGGHQLALLTQASFFRLCARHIKMGVWCVIWLFFRTQATHLSQDKNKEYKTNNNITNFLQ